MLEIEIKSHCDDLNRIEKLLLDMGALFIEELDEQDHYYNHPSRDFAVTDEALRIRVIDDKNLITYKGPKVSQKSKAREEIEVSVDNYEKLNSIFLKLGFIENEIVKKNRKIYRLNSIDICLDDVFSVGTFVELEKIGETKDEIENELFALADRLKLSKFERRSYLEMLLEKRKNNQ